MVKRILVAALALWASMGAWAEDTKMDGHFSWGAEIGSGIDVTGSDMSTIDIGVAVGYHNSWIDLVGVAAGVNMMMSNSSRYFPIAAVMRTSFTRRPSHWFADVRAGVALNSLYNQGTKANLYLSPGVGFYLARGRKFASYVTLSYIYNDASYQSQAPNQWTLSHGLSQISVRIGVNF